MMLRTNEHLAKPVPFHAVNSVMRRQLRVDHHELAVHKVQDGEIVSQDGSKEFVRFLPG